MKAIVVTPDSNINVSDVPVPALNEDSVLVKTIGCGVCGTDLLKINNHMLKESTVLGHEWVGVIEKVGAKVTQYKVGEKIVAAHHVPCYNCHYCAHKHYSMCEGFKKSNFKPGGFAEFVLISAEHLQHTTFKVPENLPWQEAIFTEPLACCIRNVNQLNIKPKDTVVVIGLGSIGLMMASLLKRQNVTVLGVDLSSERCENALSYGVTKSFMGTGDDFLAAIKEASQGRGADGVIYTGGPASGLQRGLSWVRNGGFLNLFCHLSGEKTELDVAEVYHREIQIVTTYSASPEALKEAFEILKTDELKLRRMFAPAYAPENFKQAIDDVNGRKFFKALIEF